MSTAAIAGEPTPSTQSITDQNTQQPSSIAQTPLNLEIPVPDAALETEDTLNPSATPETPVPSLELDSRENQGMEQITNVSQLRDVSPGDWAYEALRSLVERYGCIAGYPDGTFRGNRAMTRYEFAAGLNACLQQIERLIGNVPDNIEGLPTLRRLIEEFEAELATLGARVDNLEGRVAFLEDNQFSTTFNRC